MSKLAEWLIDKFNGFANAPFRKRSKVEKALIRRLTRDAERRKRAADDDTKPNHPKR